MSAAALIARLARRPAGRRALRRHVRRLRGRHRRRPRGRRRCCRRRGWSRRQLPYNLGRSPPTRCWARVRRRPARHGAGAVAWLPLQRGAVRRRQPVPARCWRSTIALSRMRSPGRRCSAGDRAVRAARAGGGPAGDPRRAGRALRDRDWSGGSCRAGSSTACCRSRCSPAAPAEGALVMLAFGAGTLPNLLAGGRAARPARAWLDRRAVRYGAALLLVAFALAGLCRALFGADGAGAGPVLHRSLAGPCRARRRDRAIAAPAGCGALPARVAVRKSAR